MNRIGARIGAVIGAVGVPEGAHRPNSPQLRPTAVEIGAANWGAGWAPGGIGARIGAVIGAVTIPPPDSRALADEWKAMFRP